MKSNSPATDDLLCVGDTKLVLGNVCATVVFNGRSIADFATVLAMAGTSFGAARSVYRLLEQYGFDYRHLERGRGPDELCSMDMLDVPPRCWADFIVTVHLAEVATRAAVASLASHSDRRVAAQAGRLTKDSAFHETYCLGWVKVLAGQERENLEAALKLRVPLLLRWLEAGFRAKDPAVADALKALGAAAGLPVPDKPAASGADWDARRRRAGALPASLWEIIRFKDVELAA